MQFRLGKNWRKASWAQKLLCPLMLVLGWGVGMPSTIAAQTVTIRLGPFQQSVALADLEKFAKTGRLPQGLELLSPVLNSQVRELLTKRLEVNPAVADRFIDNLVRSPGGRQFISSLGGVIPGSTAESIKATLNFALRQANGFSALSFLRAYPGENVTVDATKAVGLAVDLNPNNLQSQAFGVLLERELSVASSIPFKAAFDPAGLGNQVVQEQTIVLNDRQRNRTIPVDIYSSQNSSQANPENPLVVLSHGFGANRKFLSYLARHLASYGITVVAVEHPGSNFDAVNRASDKQNLAQLLPGTEFVDRPKDISFALDELAKLNTQIGQLQGKLNTEKVTVIGHSLGGYTALTLVGGELDLEELRKFCKDSLNIGEAPGDWLQCSATSLRDRRLKVKDERVKSAIALNPLVGNLFGKKGITQITKPVLILTGTEDALTPALKHQIEPFTQLRGEKYLLTAIGGTHLSISDPIYPQSAATTIVRERRGEETKSLRQLTKGVSLAFIKQLTPEAKIYKPFLTPAYAQSFSTPELPLRLASELPASIKRWLEPVEK
ncbi:dienelactone hydrolase [Brasilonema octagenarum UFV-E1]|uniref:Dienelactone hydrolase n=2 Tax=Brasilonema TaxID=383614 RepID=A0A856MJT0_9CYAN|nr:MULTISPECIES: alpha/beta hydrolase [Brasilonema]NMF67324.1 dienelactone hydrolase [Brasilonema octagenarum UFV-OR1]QDL10569.1 dienelactone hydrolase [Brasilonema sennae CENA114]QDL16912.1 dienelactone hydrolase [Brasilonema octagenarum UFV-E1]